MVQFNGIGAEQAELSQVPDLFKQAVQQGSDNQLLWQYRKLGSINGIPVAQEDRQLLFESDQSMMQALQLKPVIKTWSGWLSPDYQQSIDQYNKIKQAEADGSVSLLSQDKQYASDKNAFLVVLTYAQNKFQLNPRFEFYKQDSK